MNNFTMICNNMWKIVVLYTVLLSFNSVNAQHSWFTLPNGQNIDFNKHKGIVRAVFSSDGNIQTIQEENPDEIVRLIVTFKEEPLAVYKSKSPLRKISLISVLSFLQSSHANFRSSLNSIERQLSSQLNAEYTYTITHDYYHSLNGVALECKRGMINRIKSLTMVKNISLDREISINIKESIHQIRADIVQDSLGYDGTGVLAGVMDSGIDYKHPALGGGIGPGFRVIGGYDFANNDNDPMDDQGHGTHVAGIIGANGGEDSLRGVAPGVKFLAVKVLDKDGSGYTSNIIAGIEYCLDPDGNPETADAADVINMSFGGAASSENPLDYAVNNAAIAGVLSVIASGNSGAAGYGTVGSPGTSEYALTVGACDSGNKIAAFSSTGPDPIHSCIKPEVIAPGVKILSTGLNNSTVRMSGTSMAAPHVTGIAALLKQEHPAWLPEDIKAAIINSAHSVGDDISPYIQGHGLADALDAATLGLTVEPGILSFGSVDLSVDIWKDTINLKIKNFRDVTQNIRLDISEAVTGGGTLSFDKTSFSLHPGEEISISAVLIVPSSVPIVSAEPFAYTGKINITSDLEKVVVPFSFIKSTSLIVTFDADPITFIIVDRVTGVSKSIATETGKTKYVLPVRPENPLYIFAEMYKPDSLNPDITNRYFVARKIDSPVGLTYVFLSHEEATISMLDTMIYDAHSNNIMIDSSAFIVRVRSYTPDDGNLNMTWLIISHQNSRLYFCPLGPEFFIGKEKIHSHSNEIYALKKFMNGIQNQEDAEITSGPENYTYYNFTGSYYNPYVKSIPDYNKYFYVVFKTWESGSTGLLGIDFPFRSGKLYSNRQDVKDNPKIHTSTYLGVCYDTADGGNSMPTLRTPEFTFNTNNEAVFENMSQSKLSWDPPKPVELSTEFVVEKYKQGDTIKVEDNNSLNFPNFVTYLEGNSLYMTRHNEIVFHNTMDVFRNGDGGTISSKGLSEEVRNTMFHWNLPRFAVQTYSHNKSQTNIKPYMLWDKNQSWTPSDYIYAYYVFDNIKENTGLYRILSDTYPYKILGQSGQCTVDYEYQMPDAGEWPDNSTYLLSNRILFPSFSLLQVSVDDKAVSIVQPGQDGKIRLVLFDADSSVTSVKISLVLPSGDEILLPVTYAGRHEYNAIIPSYIPPGFVDIAARVKDVKGNKCELNASPAFYYGNITDNIQLDARLRMTSIKLNNSEDINFNKGDTLNYTISYTNYGNKDAKNILVTFPAAQYFIPVGSQSWALDSLGVNDTVKIPVSLEFLGKGQSTDKQTYYSPTITWNSGGQTYLRKHRVLVDFHNTVTHAVQNDNKIPGKFELYQNYPNPFNPVTVIGYQLPVGTRRGVFVQLKVYDMLGREVATLVNEEKPAGYYNVEFNGNELSSGIYFYRIQAGNFVDTKKLILLK